VPQVEVMFEIDANGILNVSAKDIGTGKQAKITISAATKLSKDEKEKMVKDAEQYAEQDKKKMEEAQLLNDADSMLYTAEKTKADLVGKLSAADATKIDDAAKELRTAIEAKNADDIRAKSEKLGKVLQEVGTAVYQQAAQAQAQGQPGAAGPQAGPDPGQQQSGENVTDANYKVVDDEKKQ
jgi:molecular chaperone DnaK